MRKINKLIVLTLVMSAKASYLYCHSTIHGGICTSRGRIEIPSCAGRLCLALKHVWDTSLFISHDVNSDSTPSLTGQAIVTTVGELGWLVDVNEICSFKMCICFLYICRKYRHRSVELANHITTECSSRELSISGNIKLFANSRSCRSISRCTHDHYGRQGCMCD